MLQSNEVFLYKIDDTLINPIEPLFNPPAKYPEYPFSETDNNNYIYEAVRNIFISAGYDKENIGLSSWNPLSEFIKQGQTVLIKPNLVLERSLQKGQDYLSVITNPAIIRVITDYVYIALQGKGKIIIGDAPVNNANFEKICQNAQLKKLQQFYQQKGIEVELIDFRLYTMEKNEEGVISNISVKDNISDYIEVKVDKASALREIENNYKQFSITEYTGNTMREKHNLQFHRYCFHKSILTADVIISIPKIKTHRKAGFTCAMKNWVGLNGNKDWLPHHRKGAVCEGGDEYLNKSYRKKLITASWEKRWSIHNAFIQTILLYWEAYLALSGKFIPFKDPYFEGSWWGNKTISKTVNDLNRAVLYSDSSGIFHKEKQRKVLYLVDGIICGEGEGPMMATAKRCNTLLWGENAYVIDRTVAQLIGFDASQIDTLVTCENLKEYPVFSGKPQDIRIKSNLRPGYEHTISNLRQFISYNFTPSSGWKGHIELTK